MSETMIINFKAKGMEYTMTVPHDSKHDRETILNVYKQLGLKPKQVTHQRLTFHGWNFWCDYIV